MRSKVGGAFRVGRNGKAKEAVADRASPDGRKKRHGMGAPATKREE